MDLLTIVIGVAALLFGFIVGNRSAKGEGAALLSDVKADAVALKARVVALEAKIAAKV